MKTQQLAKIFLIHLVIFVLYLSLTFYKFVIEKNPNPTGIGILQWIFILMHCLGILIFYAAKKSGGNKNINQQLLTSLLLFFLTILIYLMISSFIWSWLWKIREDAIT